MADKSSCPSDDGSSLSASYITIFKSQIFITIFSNPAGLYVYRNVKVQTFDSGRSHTPFLISFSINIRPL